MAEKEEAFKKKDEEKKRKEEEEEQERDQKLRLSNERLRQERPQRLEELLKMDLDSAPIKELKSIMEKMAISPRGCLNRKDLKEKLVDSVPELRLKAPSGSSPTASGKDYSIIDLYKWVYSAPLLLWVAPCEMRLLFSRALITVLFIGGNSLNSIGSTMPIDNESESLRKTLAKTEADLRQMTARAQGSEDSLQTLKSRLTALQNQVRSLKEENSSLRSRTSGSVHAVRDFMGATWRRSLLCKFRLLEVTVQRSRNWKSNCWRRECFTPLQLRILRL